VFCALYRHAPGGVVRVTDYQVLRPDQLAAGIEARGDEILLCGSGEEVTPVVAVDRLPVGDATPGPVTRTLQRVFFAAARGDDAAFAGSLTPVYVARA